MRLSTMAITTFIALWMLFYGLITSDPVNGAVSHGRLQYTRTTLLQLNCGITCVTDITPQLPDFILKDSGKNTRATKRKQGKRGGVRQRFRKQRLSRIPLPPHDPRERPVPEEQSGWAPGKRRLSEGLQGLLCPGFHGDLADGEWSGHRLVNWWIWCALSTRPTGRGNTEISRWRSMSICQQMLLHLCDCKRTYQRTRCRTFIGITTTFLPAPWVSTTFYNYSIHSPKGECCVGV